MDAFPPFVEFYWGKPGLRGMSPILSRDLPLLGAAAVAYLPGGFGGA